MNKFLKIGFTGMCFGLIGFGGYYIQDNLPELQDRLKISYTVNRYITDQLKKQALIDFEMQNALVHMINNEDPTIKTSLFDFPIKERDQIKRIIEALYYECRGEDITGIVMVAKNLRSRVGRENFGSSFQSVITQPNQYEYLEHKKWRYENIKAKHTNIYRLIKQIALYTYQDRLEDLKKVIDYDWRTVQKIKNPLFYASKKLVQSGQSKFFNNMYRGNRKNMVDVYFVGNHVFFDVKENTKLALLTN